MKQVANYFGVIGNRDYIKYQGERRPFWEFLDEQPDGWLCSLAYKREDVPGGKPMIWDCGAWSYKDKETPVLGGKVVSAAWAVQEYRRLATEGDFVIAPDHILIPGTDLDSRRWFNRISAVGFIHRCPYYLRPMAVVHGTTHQERELNAEFFIRLGYKALALGGLAGRASSRTMVLEVVSRFREKFPFPSVWLHVLGVSSPFYAAEWRRLGVNSFDGASHFKQAFTAGKFFIEEEGKLISYQASRPGEPVTAPVCNCRACARLRLDKIDTRSYGSNENNMGRAAHNLNQLIRAFEYTERLAG